MGSDDQCWSDKFRSNPTEIYDNSENIIFSVRFFPMGSDDQCLSDKFRCNPTEIYDNSENIIFSVRFFPMGSDDQCLSDKFRSNPTEIYDNSENIIFSVRFFPIGSDDRNILSVPDARMSSEILGNRPPGSEVFSLPGIRSDFIGWSDPTRSDRIQYRIDSPG